MEERNGLFSELMNSGIISNEKKIEFSYSEDSNNLVHEIYEEEQYPVIDRQVAAFSQLNSKEFSNKSDAVEFYREKTKKWEKVSLIERKTGSISNWTVNFSMELPFNRALIPIYDRLEFDTINSADKRRKILSAYGLVATVGPSPNKLGKFKCKITNILGSPPGVSLPTKIGVEIAFTYPKKEFRDDRLTGLKELGYKVEPFDKDQRFAIRILDLPKINSQVVYYSRWHKIIPGTKPSPVKPFITGESYYDELAKAITTTNSKGHFIYILGWTLVVDFNLGKSLSNLFQLLKAAGDRGVEIRIIIWENMFDKADLDKAEQWLKQIPNCRLIRDSKTYGSSKVMSLISSLKVALGVLINEAAKKIPYAAVAGSAISGAISQFNTSIPLKAVSYQIEAKKLFDRIASFPKSPGSHHEKIIVVNGSTGLIGFCGGMDIYPDRLVGNSKGTRHDVHCQVKGQCALDLLSRFVMRWETFHYPAKPSLIAANNYLKYPLSQPPNLQETTLNTRLFHTFNHWQKTTNERPITKDRSFQEILFKAIDNAQSSFYMEDQYMISLSFAKKLNSKIRQITTFKVEILIQDDKCAYDLYFPKRKREEFKTELYRGLSASEASRINIYQIKIDPLLPYQMVHSKLKIIDNEVVFIGSHNCSSRSLTYDTETSIVAFSNTPNNMFVKNLKQDLDNKHKAYKIPYKKNPNFWDLDEKFMPYISKPGVNSVIKILHSLYDELIEPEVP